MQNKYNTNNHMTVAQQVEGLFFYMMLKSMRNSFPRNTLIENNQERIYEDIYDQFITQKISEKGLGLAKMIEKQIQETKK
ncbi:MAG: rod-binding protein [Buchnera aphidicola (Meitanaphis elongallis)]